ncbi:MAG TPA: leucine-rich repeat protein [Clostridia bacterium]|nr:leucine-rich repeat protein [Clostridia bacterium]
MKRNFKRIFSVFVACTLLALSVQISLVTVNAAVSGIYTYTVSNNEAKIIECDFEKANGIITIPETLGGYPVVEIGEYAFQWCDGITDVIIGDNISTIGAYAFYWCDSLKTVVIGDSLVEIKTATFLFCQKLESVTFGNSIKTISADAFANCTKLDNLVFPDSLETIKSYAFKRCTFLTNISFGSGIKTIENNAFYYCESLGNVVMPISITTIGKSAFTNCTNLIMHCYKNSVSHIYAMENNIQFVLLVSLESISITSLPTKLLYVIGDELDLSGLVVTVYFDNETNEVVGDYAVSGFSSGTVGTKTVTVTYETKTDSFEVEIIDFNYSLINPTQVEITDYLGVGGDVVIPSFIDGITVVSIGDNAFRNCTNIDSITMPDTVTSIGNNAFNNCTGISQIDILQNVTSIAKTAFMGCSSLKAINVSSANGYYKSVNGVLFSKNASKLLLYPSAKSGVAYTVPSSVRDIDKYAFHNCKNLNSLTISYSVVNIDEDAIVGISGLTINCYEYTKAQEYAIDNAISYNLTATVNDISITSLPTKLTYLVNESLELSGIEVMTIYTDGTTIETTDFTANAINSSRVGVETVTISFGGYTDSFQVSIVEPEETVYQYILINGNEAKITGYTGSGGDISVPTTINSYLITAIGDNAFENYTSISTIQLNNNITSIGNNAFSRCNNISEIYIPSSVLTIGDNAFYNCTGLTSVSGMNSVESIGELAFYNCTGLTQLNVPNSVESIGDSAFYNCANVQKITIGSGVTLIGNSAFWGCQSLKEIIVDQMNTAYSDSDGVLYNKGQSTIIYYPLNKSDTQYTLSDNVKKINSYAFYKLSLLNELTIPKSVNIIYIDAIKDCSNLTINCYDNSQAHLYAIENDIGFTLLPSPQLINISIYTLPTKLEYVKNESLDLTGLKVVANFEDDSSEIIENYTVSPFDSSQIGIKTITVTYDECTASFDVEVVSAQQTPSFTYVLVENDTKAKITGYTGAGGAITIPAIIDGYEVVSIAEKAFFRNNNITSVVVSYGIEEIGISAFLECSKLKHVTISGSVKTICADAFYKCTELAEIVLGNGIEEISSYAFSECTSLKRLTIPESVTSLGNSAFAGCTSLTNINLPETIEKIEGFTFSDCTNLTTAILGASISNIGYNAFRNCYNLLIYCYENTYVHSYAVNNAINYMLIKNFGDYIISEINQTDAQLVRYIGNNVSLVVPTQIDGLNITKITAYSFSNCTNLNSVTLQDGVSYIGAGAFSDCRNLTKITIPDTVTNIIGLSVFDGVDNLTIYCHNNTVAHLYAQNNGFDFIILDIINLVSITVTTLPEKTVYYIGQELDLTGIVVVANYSNATYEYIENYTVSGFSSQTEGNREIKITYNNRETTFNVTIITPVFIYEKLTQTSIRLTGYNGTDVDVTIPDIIDGLIVKEIGANMFSGYYALESVVIPNTVAVIGNSAFLDCKNLTVISIGTGVTTIRTSAFAGCTALESIVIPYSVQKINGYVFNGCTSLKTIFLGSSVNEIGYSAFRDCTAIENINVNHKNNYFVSVDGVLYNSSMTELVCYTSGKTDSTYDIPYTVTRISDYSFNGCLSLHTLNILKRVTTISASSFNACNNISIHCYKGSEAHLYALRNQISYVLKDNNQLSLINGASTLEIDLQNGYLTGLDYPGETVAGLVSKFNNVKIVVLDKNGQILSGQNRVGTGCKLQLLNDNNVVLQQVNVIVFGDVDGDGSYNGNDAVIVRLYIANLISADSLGALAMIAADVNKDGIVDENDAIILELSGLFLESISQTNG